MSIYATLDTIQYEDEHGVRHEICFQGVPGHITYTGEKWDWLPPPLPQADTQGDDWRLRAVVVISGETHKGTPRNGQEYLHPLFILTGEEYERITWREMMERIGKAIQEQEARL